MLVDFPERDLTVDVGSEPLLSVLLLESLVPVGGGEFEDALSRPTREETEQVAEVCRGLDLVELAAREQGDEPRVDRSAIVAANKEPVFATDCFAAELALAEVMPRSRLCRARVHERAPCRA